METCVREKMNEGKIRAAGRQNKKKKNIKVIPTEERGRVKRMRNKMKCIMKRTKIVEKTETESKIIRKKITNEKKEERT